MLLLIFFIMDLPVLDAKRFAKALFELNGRKNFQFRNWLFLPGMGFGDKQKWWSGGEERLQSHEGVDICRYEDTCGNQCLLKKDTKVPLLMSGRIVAICDDFLGKSVFVKGSAKQGRWIAVHAHITTELLCGDFVEEGDAAGQIASGRSVIPAHFHLSLIKYDSFKLPDKLDWHFLNTSDQGIFVDPFGTK